MGKADQTSACSSKLVPTTCCLPVRRRTILPANHIFLNYHRDLSNGTQWLPDFLWRVNALLLRGPALFHQTEQMLQGVLVAAIFHGGKLPGTFVELRGHFRRFFGRTSQQD